MSDLRLSRGDEMLLESPPDPLFGLAATAAILALAAFLIWWRSRKYRADLPSRWLRILYSALAFGTALTLKLAAEALWHGRGTAALFPEAAIGLVAITLIMVVLFGIVEFWLGLFRPSRTIVWLIVAGLLLAALVNALVLAILWFENMVEGLVEYGELQLAAFGALAGLIWWSYLPSPPPDMSNAFD